MASSIDIDSYTTMPRKRRDRLPTAEELQEMSLERRLATLNISQSRVPVPPPRLKKIQKRMISLPDKMPLSPTKHSELYGEKSSSYDGDTTHVSSKESLRQYGYKYSQPVTKQTYSKYEVPRKERGSSKRENANIHPMCDIIQSSQQTGGEPMMRRPDILRGSFNADLQSMLADSDGEKSDSYHRYQKPTRDNDTSHRVSNIDNNKNLIHTANRSTNNNRQDSLTRRSRSKRGDQTTDQKHSSPLATSTPTKADTGHSRFMFYRPRLDKLTRQHNSAIGLVGMAEGGNNTASSVVSSEGSFVNPAFEIVDLPSSPPAQQPKPVKPVQTSARTVYSTMGSSFSTRPCTPSPPSQRFRNSKPPLPPAEPKISPKNALGPTPLKPMMSAKQLETSLKQYSSHNRLDTTDMCSPQSLENMMKYYKMGNDDDIGSDSPTPPPMKLSASKKNQSPYSSSGSLNVSGDSIEVVLRRKKKIKIRPISFSSDDESAKRVSLEINLAPTNSTTNTNLDDNNRNDKESPDSKSLSINQTSIEKLELDDLTSTETAKLLRKQFAKLKVKASSLKVKDTELKQRFALLQNQRGRVCGHGGSVSKSKIRSSPILL